MATKFFLMLSMLMCTFAFSQTEIYFKYDEAGNQRYRGDDINAKQTDENVQQVTNALTEKNAEEKFWRDVNIYPVPVQDILTIDWTSNIDELIDMVSLYQFSTVNWKFQQKNIPSLNHQVKINMTGYYLGVYVLSFTLKDGRVYTRNIIKE